MYVLCNYSDMTHDDQPKQPDMANEFTYENSDGRPGDFFYGVDHHLAFFIKIYVILFFLFLLVVLSLLKDYAIPGFSYSRFFSSLLFHAGS
jgi:hypothetical protein